MRAFVRRHESAAFVGLTFALSWPLWAASGVLEPGYRRVLDVGWMVAQLGVFAPAFAGLVLAPMLGVGSVRSSLRTLALVYAPAVLLGFVIATRGLPGLADLGTPLSLLTAALALWGCLYFAREGRRAVPWPGARVGRRVVTLWTVVAAVLPVVLYMGAWVLTASGSSGPAAGATEAPLGGVRPLAPWAIVTGLAFSLPFGGALGEEPGWRGFWLPRLLRHERPLGASLIVSVVWALWHAPIDFTQGFGLPGIGGMLVRQLWTLPVTVLFTWVTIRAAGSLLPALAFHTTVNAIPDFAMADPARYARATALYFVLSVALAVAVVLRDRALRRDVTSTAATSAG